MAIGGVESEMELAFAGLHQLCWPLREHLGAIPGPQSDVLSTAFGVKAGDGRVPDQFRVGLAALSLLAESASCRPLVCVVDDAQWLDHASAQVLAFVARRLGAEAVGLVFGARTVSAELAGLPEMVVGGLPSDDARVLLRKVLTVTVGSAVLDQIVAETGGNPLALLELPKGLTAGELAAGFVVPVVQGLSGSIEEGFRRRADELAPEARSLLLLAAAEPLGDAAVLWRAAAEEGIGTAAAPPLEEAGLIAFGDRVAFRHPLVRSAIYQSASPQERRGAHAALAEATDPDLDPDRRAWHRALAATGRDEEVASELERCAARAQRRGGLAAAGAFLERSASLTVHPERRAERTIAAAARYFEAGGFEVASSLLASAETGPLNESLRARVERLRGDAAAGWGHMGDSTDLYLSAARRLEPIDVRLARDTYLTALVRAELANDLARTATVVEVALAARAAPPPPVPSQPHDLLLDGLAVAHLDGFTTAAPILREALDAFLAPQLSAEQTWWLGYSQIAAGPFWDYDAHYSLGTRFLQTARELGALRMLPWALDVFSLIHIWGGDLATAASLLAESQAVLEATGSTTTPRGAAHLAAWRGNEAEAKSVIAATIEQARSRGQGGTIKLAQAAKAILCNALGHYDEGRIAADMATRPPLHASPDHELPELVEAAVRSGRLAAAAEALERLSASTQASGTDWALGVEARSRALLSAGDAAEALYREAIERLDRSPLRPQAARAHLLYGEWLRRERRRADARDELRMAHSRFDAMGMDAFADRARRELGATGETARKRSTELGRDLTPREAQIAALARDGLSNAEIGIRLFISAHTVDYHMRKVFNKLDITSRNQLHGILP